jgi:hypothetical protein
VRTFVNVTMYPDYNYNMIIKILKIKIRVGRVTQMIRALSSDKPQCHKK